MLYKFDCSGIDENYKEKELAYYIEYKEEEKELQTSFKASYKDPLNIFSSVWEDKTK